MNKTLRWTLAAVLLAACSSDDTPSDADGDVALDASSDATDAMGDGSGDDPDASLDAADAAPDVPQVDLPTVDEVLADGPYAVGRIDVTWVDEARPLPANGPFEGAPSRSLRSVVLYPAQGEGGSDAAGDASGGPYPVVVYAHGFMSDRTDNLRLMQWLASQGYIAASLDFPLSTRTAPGGATLLDIVNQPGDVSYVLDQLETASQGDGALAGMVDMERVGVVGVSLGAMTSLLVGYHPDFRDERIDAVAAVAAPTCYLPLDLFDRSQPLLFVHGDIDAIVPYAESAPAIFDTLPAPAILATIVGGTHSSFPDIASVAFASLPNADTVGCSAIGESVPADELRELSESVGGRTVEELTAQCSLPCEDTSNLPESIDVAVQADLLLLTVGPFFDGALRDDPAGTPFVTQALPAAYPDELTVRVR